MPDGIEGYGVSDPGRSRAHNEDTFRVLGPLGLAVVADGMGGHQAGEIAARLAADTFSEFVGRALLDHDVTWPFGLDPGRSLAANCLATGVRLAHQRVAQQAAAEADLMGMGTTLVTTLVCGSLLVSVGVGDSRAYLVRNGTLHQLTRDDTWIQSAIASGLVAIEDRLHHPLRHVLTKAVGIGLAPDVDIVETPLASGDRILLCSDGLTSVLPDDRIADILRDPRADLAPRCEALIAAANAAGGPDNITVVLLRPSREA